MVGCEGLSANKAVDHQPDPLFLALTDRYANGIILFVDLQEHLANVLLGIVGIQDNLVTLLAIRQRSLFHLVVEPLLIDVDEGIGVNHLKFGSCGFRHIYLVIANLHGPLRLAVEPGQHVLSLHEELASADVHRAAGAALIDVSQERCGCELDAEGTCLANALGCGVQHFTCLAVLACGRCVENEKLRK